MQPLHIILIVIFCGLTSVSCSGLREEFTWTRISYEWPRGRTSRQTSRKVGRPKPSSDVILFPDGDGSVGSTARPPSNIPYIFENNIPMGANLWNNKLFVTVPRRRVGVPSTLNYVWANSTQRRNVPLIPYPDWDTNTLRGENNGERFVSVYRVAVDSCQRLWFVDTGLIETPGNHDQVQPTALVIMDLTTDRVIQRHVFNDTLLRPTSTLASLTIDITNNKCGEAFAYIPDVGGYGLVVYSLKENKSWRVTHNYFYLEPTAGEFSIGGHNFQWNDGIFSIAISAQKHDEYKDAYFHSMAGHNLYRVSTRILKNEVLATRSYQQDDFKIVGNRGESSQTSESDLHPSKGILFLALVNQNALGCWNVRTPLKDISVVQKDDSKMIYPSDVKISGDDVVVLTNTMPVFLYGTLDYNAINFRVWIESVDKAVEGTKCATKKRNGY